MGPKKDGKKGVLKTEGGPVAYSIDDPINTDAWSCAVVMAVEKTFSDGFILKEFLKESLTRRRHEVYVIDFDTLIMDVLNYFAGGELPYKYAFLLNFSSIFLEAVTYVTQKTEIPVFLLVKVVKALLFYLKDESLKKIKNSEVKVLDPIKAMAEKENTVRSTDTKKMEILKKGESRLKVRPPSVTKENTLLLKRGEGTKYDQRIDDAPRNNNFKLYVLLTGFYKPDFPLELIKAGVPLHSLLCVDTALLGVKDSDLSISRFQKQCPEVKSLEIINFWTVFLKILWDPKTTHYFKNTVFQVYMPPKFVCNKKKFREFIYKEISYLLYEISDLERQLLNYLKHLSLWDVALKEIKAFEIAFEEIDALPSDCITVPVVLQYTMDAICREEEARQHLTEIQSLKTTEQSEFEDSSSLDSPDIGFCGTNQSISKELEERGEFHLLQACLKTKELDVKYELCDNNVDVSSVEDDSDDVTCAFKFKECGENLKEALLMSDGVFRSYWKKYPKHLDDTYEIDYYLYSLLMTKVMCLYENNNDTTPSRSICTDQKSSFSEDITRCATKTRFTVTEGSRFIVRSTPLNKKSISRDHFCPKEFQIVSSEKLQACSAPTFRVSPTIQVQHLYQSEIFQCEIFKNPLKNVKKFLDDSLSNTDGFNFLELLNKPKLLMKECEHWNAYNCIDHSYSFLDDSIYFVLHNRKDAQNVHHETFNEGLKSGVGLRDFYDYVMEEESAWLRDQDELSQISVFLINTIIRSDSFRYTNDYEFWLVDSLKYQYSDESQRNNKKIDISGDIRTEPSMQEKADRIKINTLKKKSMEEFQAYDVSEMAVQFSGLKTIYYSNDCYVTVQLIERLYGNQELGVHVTAASNTLYLYSYVCPEPHVLDPFTFHFTYKNGIIIAFGRRFVELVEEIEESIEKYPSRTTLKGKRNSSESPEAVVLKQVSKTIKDEIFLYDMVASLPNGLSIRTVRSISEPCYIKQHYLVKSEEIGKLENSRLFLPNGNVVKMMTNGTVEIFKINTSTVTANLSDLSESTGLETPIFEKFKLISGEGFDQVFEQRRLKSSNRVQIFQNTDLETSQVYFRRRDGTNYMMQKDGSLCIQFKDGTRMSTTLLENTSSSRETISTVITPETDLDDSFVFVHFEFTVEHPDYATVIYNTLSQKWKILLPNDSTITVEPNGCYYIDIDKQTELRVQDDAIEMERFSPNQERLSIFTADLSVFENPWVANYCQMKDTSGKIFTLKSDSNYNIETSTEEVEQLEKVENLEELEEDQIINNSTTEGIPQSELDESDLKSYGMTQMKNNKLSREKKYFVVKRDLTGVELMHGDDVNRELTEGGKGSLIYTLDIPEIGGRCFVLITPQPKEKLKKWEVKTILPDPKYKANPKPKTTSSTYGVPPSWMHPFPKKKAKFVVPSPLTCRVFLETTKTDLSPQVGKIDNLFSEINEITEVKHSKIPPGETDEFLIKLSNDDQDMLKEMYALSMISLINEKKKLKPVNSEKLKHYLEMSKYYVELREYHKNCIRYNALPDYFHHPAGMSWLILNDLLLKMSYPSKEPQAELLAKKNAAFGEGLPSSKASEFSNEEIEYNLSVSACQSFSDLSFRSDLSAETAPAILRNDGVCRCNVKGMHHPVSSPVIKLHTPKEAPSAELIKEPEIVCGFKEKDIEKIEIEDCGGMKTPRVSLEDLMNLGLV